MPRSVARVALAAAFAAALTLQAVSAAADQPGGVTRTAAPVSGAQVYEQVCQACHLTNGQGGSGAAVIPALADNPRLASASYPITLVVHGRGAMPGFTDLLAPAQIANVVGFVRTHFGNAYPAPVTAADVSAVEGPARTPPAR